MTKEKEEIKKKYNYYWVWDYGAVVPFNFNWIGDDGLLDKGERTIVCHIGREELEEYIEILQYALKKRKQFKQKLNEARKGNDFS